MQSFEFSLYGFRIVFDFWLIFGFIAQGLFFLRFVIQWIASERKKESVFPLAFWYFSIVGTVLLAIYSFHRQDPVFFLGSVLNLFIYLRNLMLIYKKKTTTG